MESGLSSSRLHALTRATDRLILRPGHLSWIRSQGAWQSLDTTPLERTDYDAMRAELIALSHAFDSAAGNVWPRRLRLANGVTLALECVATPDGELLQVRPVHLDAPDATILHGDRVALETTLALDDALILAVSDDAAVARRLLHALISWRIASGPEPVLLIGDDATYRHSDAATPIVHAKGSEIARMLATFERATVAIDPALGNDAPRAAALQNAGLILAGATGPDPARAISRWLLAIAGDEPGARASLTGRELLVAWGDGEADDESALTFRLWTPPAHDPTQIGSSAPVGHEPGDARPRLKVVRPKR